MASGGGLFMRSAAQKAALSKAVKASALKRKKLSLFKSKNKKVAIVRAKVRAPQKNAKTKK